MEPEVSTTKARVSRCPPAGPGRFGFFGQDLVLGLLLAVAISPLFQLVDIDDERLLALLLLLEVPHHFVD